MRGGADLPAVHHRWQDVHGAVGSGIDLGTDKAAAVAFFERRVVLGARGRDAVLRDQLLQQVRNLGVFKHSQLVWRQDVARNTGLDKAVPGYEGEDLGHIHIDGMLQRL